MYFCLFKKNESVSWIYQTHPGCNHGLNKGLVVGIPDPKNVMILVVTGIMGGVDPNHS